MGRVEFLEELDQLLGFQTGTLQGSESLSDIQLWAKGHITFALYGKLQQKHPK
jgi:hypothetical protein